MELLMLVVFDSKANAYLQPFFAPTRAVGERAFAGQIMDPSSNFFRFAADYTLFEVGKWSAVEGTIEVYEVKVNLGNGSQFVNYGSEG